MANKPRPKRPCPYCGKEYVYLEKHMERCPERYDAFGYEYMLKPAPGELTNIYSIRVVSASRKFWFTADVCGGISFTVLDEFIRCIWFNLTEHISAFIFGNNIVLETGPFENPKEPRYTPDRILSSISREYFRPDVPLDDLFQIFDECRYEYDYGTTSRAVITVEKVRQEPFEDQEGFVLTGQNEWKREVCSYCGQPADWIDIWISGIPGKYTYYCDECLDHKLASGEADYSFAEYRNSPRVTN